MTLKKSKVKRYNQAAIVPRSGSHCLYIENTFKTGRLKFLFQIVCRLHKYSQDNMLITCKMPPCKSLIREIHNR